MFEVKLSRQQLVEDMRKALRPIKQEIPPTTEAEMKAHITKCCEEYKQTGRRDSPPTNPIGTYRTLKQIIEKGEK